MWSLVINVRVKTTDLINYELEWVKVIILYLFQLLIIFGTRVQ